MKSTTKVSQRRGLGAGVIILIVLDVMLVALVALMLAGVVGPLKQSAETAKSKSPSTDNAGGFSSSPGRPSASAIPGGLRPPLSGEAFASPSGNISCTMRESSARCGISSLMDKPMKAVGCDQRIGYVAVLDSAGIETPCEQAPGVANEQIRTLGYNESVTVGDFTCASTQEGMKCSDRAAGRGFVIARAGIRTF